MPLKIVIKGRVQGVGFRYYTKKNADALGICGWVKNRQDGSVEVLAEAEGDQLDKFIGQLRQGPSSAVVESLKKEPTEQKSEGNGFFIKE